MLTTVLRLLPINLCISSVLPLCLPFEASLGILELQERGIARDGYKVLDRASSEIGYVTSGSYAPFLKKNIALAYVPPEHAEIGSMLGVEIRGQAAKAQVVPTPFYKRPKKAA